MNNYQFVNPYNFIPLSSEKTVENGSGEKGNYTGVIEYSVLTRTPLFIPNTSKDNIFPESRGTDDHKSYDFFTYKDLSGQDGPAENEFPVIPGSEIRGMFRSYFEILSNSCMSAVDDKDILSKRTNEVFKAGLLEKGKDGGFNLIAARDCLMRTRGKNDLEDDWNPDYKHYTRQCYIQDSLKEGQKVYFKLEDRGGRIKPLAKNVSTSKSKTEGTDVGYVLKGEAGPDMKGRKQQKHCCHIFVPIFWDGQGRKPRDFIFKENIDMHTLYDVLKEYADNGEHPYKEYREELDKFREGTSGEKYFPVYYSIVLNNLMLSPAAITREIYSTKIEDLIGSYHTCNDKNNLCPACSLFGTIGDNFAIASRVRFSDLECRAESAAECFEKPKTLAPLSSPKINNMEFYLRRPEGAVFWTYDYYINAKGAICPNTSGINGRKFYWHNMNPKFPEFEASNQNITIRPVKKDILFSGKIYFKDITRKELDQLIFLLNCGDDTENIRDKKHGYKLGGAKPLGLGSIAVSVDSVILRKVIRDDDKHTVGILNEEYNEGVRQDLFDPDILSQFEKMTDFYALEGKNVDYPRTEAGGDIFDWFSKNHVKVEEGQYVHGMPNRRNQMAYARYLKAMEPNTKSTKQ